MKFADHLRTWSTEALAELLTARPDLLPASDEGFDALARKAATANSLGRCLVRADVAMFLVAQALTVSHPSTADEIDELLGTNDVDAVLDAIGRLAAQGIVIVEDGVVSPVGALEDLLHRPLGLGPSFVELVDNLASSALDDLAARLDAEGSTKRSATARAVARRLCDPEGLGRVVGDAPDGVRDALAALVAQRSPAVSLGVGYHYRSVASVADDPLAWLLAHGLLVPVSESIAELPREIVIGSHPEGLAPTAVLRPIEVRPVSGLPADSVAAAAADAASRTLEAAEALVRLVADGEIAVRKAGGVGAREVKRLAKLVELGSRDVARLLELLLEAHLIVPRDGRVALSSLAEAWWRLPRGRRWLVLVRAWVAAAGFPSIALSPDHDDRPIPALGNVETVAAAFGGRRVAIELAASVPAGSAYDPEQLTEAIVWRSPNLWGTGEPPPERLVAWTLAEAELLGLVAMNAPAPPLGALAESDEARLESLANSVLGVDQDQFVLQTDLTALALGPLDPEVAGKLAVMADRLPESTVPQFRFTETSFRRAFDRGWTAPDIAAFLSDHALSGVPQPLSYLLADVDRRYGSIKVMAAASVIVTEDEATAVEIASSTRAARLGLRLIAPTVLVGPVEPHQLLDELRTEGFFPVLDGEVLRLHSLADEASAPTGLPAAWTGPVLGEVALPGEVEAAVDVLRATGEEPAPSPSDAKHLLHLLWNRPAIVTHLRDGQLTEARGVVVAVDESLTLLKDSGVEELPLDAVVAVEDPTH